MTTTNPVDKLKELLSLADDIRQSTLEPEHQYHLIFSDKISKKIYAIFKEFNYLFDYYDPDTSYEEDMDYFLRAVREHVDLLSTQENIDILQRYTQL
jgi:hypothetical protein